MAKGTNLQVPISKFPNLSDYGLPTKWFASFFAVPVGALV